MFRTLKQKTLAKHLFGNTSSGVAFFMGGLQDL